MSDTLKTIAEYMGWKYDQRLANPCVKTYPDGTGRMKTFNPTTCLNDLQKAVDKFTPAQCDRYYEKKYSFARAVIKKAGANGDMLSKRMECIPTKTLADIVAQVITETT